MRRRTLPFAAALVVTASVLAGCSDPAPAPSPSGTGFATEAEAFAAAEATYRAYVEALNRVDLSDPNTFEDVYRWTTGEANAAERKSLSDYHARGLSVSGETMTESFRGRELLPSDSPRVTAIACSNIGGIRLFDASGTSQVPENRPAVYQLELEFNQTDSSPTRLLIATSRAVEGTECAG